MNKDLNLNSFAALIGIDWADQKHDFCLKDNHTKDIEYSKFLHKPAAIEEWALSLRKRFNGQKIAIALELKTGPLVHALLRYDFIVIVPISPQALAKYREVFPKVEPRMIQAMLILLLIFSLAIQTDLNP